MNWLLILMVIAGDQSNRPLALTSAVFSTEVACRNAGTAAVESFSRAFTNLFGTEVDRRGAYYVCVPQGERP